MLRRLALNTIKNRLSQSRCINIKTVKTLPMGESITEGTLTEWHKGIGDYVERDEQIATIETDKIDVTVNSPHGGIVEKLFVGEGETVAVGGDLFAIDLDGKGSKTSVDATSLAPAPSVKDEVVKSGPARIDFVAPKTDTAIADKEDTSVNAHSSVAPISHTTASTPVKAETITKDNESPKSLPSTSSKVTPDLIEPVVNTGARIERAVKMNRMRLRIAERLKESQNTAASLTTFNEIDMSALIALRKQYKDLFLEKHKVKLGFMGAFMKACSVALMEIPGVNSRIEGDHIIFSDFVDISVAVSTPKGLVTPVIRSTESRSIAQLESELAGFGRKAKANDISIEDMAGGTFTISNGGVFGSLYGTPIINLPQGAIFGMHAVKDRAVVVDGLVVARPMMYVALTYDHRLIDGREATTFLVRVKELIEDPARLVLDV